MECQVQGPFGESLPSCKSNGEWGRRDYKNDAR